VGSSVNKRACQRGEPMPSSSEGRRSATQASGGVAITGDQCARWQKLCKGAMGAVDRPRKFRQFRIADNCMPHIVSRQHTIEGVLFGILPRAQARIPGQNCLISPELLTLIPGAPRMWQRPCSRHLFRVASHSRVAVTQLSAFSSPRKSSMPRPPAARGGGPRAAHAFWMVRFS